MQSIILTILKNEADTGKRVLNKVEKKQEPKYRHELKYICTAAELAMIQGRIHHLIPLDSHAGADGMYQIRSLYFDDYYDRCY